MAKSSYFYGLGRRKSATARVRLFSGKGDIVINDKPASDYFDGSKNLLNELTKPFNVLELDPEKYHVSAKVAGGGHASQVDAARSSASKAPANSASLPSDSLKPLRKGPVLRYNIVR
jgi:small subunit ribosomal protein S9